MGNVLGRAAGFFINPNDAKPSAARDASEKAEAQPNINHMSSSSYRTLGGQ